MKCAAFDINFLNYKQNIIYIVVSFVMKVENGHVPNDTYNEINMLFFSKIKRSIIYTLLFKEIYHKSSYTRKYTINFGSYSNAKRIHEV